MSPISWLSHVQVQSKDKELAANAYQARKSQANGAWNGDARVVCAIYDGRRGRMGKLIQG
jgi:hypothetical protein